MPTILCKITIHHPLLTTNYPLLTTHYPLITKNRPIILDRVCLACYNPPLMRKLFKSVLYLVVLMLIGIINTSLVSADSGCVPVYGGGVQCPRVGQVLIDKTVKNPSTGIFVDNLTPGDPKYRPERLVTFKLVIKNTGDQTIDKITVTDKLPDYVDFTSGPGSYNKDNKTVTFEITNLTSGSSQLYYITARVVHASVLPGDKNVVCPVNTAEAVTSSQKDSDSSQFCIEKEMIVPNVPNAGPEHWILSFTGLGTILTAGLYLRKKALFS